MRAGAVFVGISLTLSLLGGVSPAAAALPPITEADWAAAAPASDPNAGALVLYKSAEFQLMDLRQEHIASFLRLRARIKVLTPQGLESGELEIPHSRQMRLASLTGRTLLPGGVVVPLPADAKFDRRQSKRARTWVTAVAFPALQVGAILEYEVELRFDSVFALEPWYLSDRWPVRFAEVAFLIPKSLEATSWGLDPRQSGLKMQTIEGRDHRRFEARAAQLPALPDEPYAAPVADLATQFGILTTAYREGLDRVSLFESWESTCKWVNEGYYVDARLGNRGVKQRARELVSTKASPRDRAEAIYRFVRDELRTEDAKGITLEEGSTLQRVLSEASGDYAEKALLLQAMLDAVAIHSRLVWANERSSGVAFLQVPNPTWFERMLVAVDLPEGRVYLDPSARGLAFGTLAAEVEGSQALLYDPRAPEIITLPAGAPAERNGRTVNLRLSVTEEGGVSGGGELLLTGHHAVEAIGEAEVDDPKTIWEEWLVERLPAFRFESVAVTPAADAAEVRVSWQMATRPEEELGDELSLLPSRPLGPLSQPLVLTAEARRTPLILPFPDRDEVTLELTLPRGWRHEALPPKASIENATGSFHAATEIDEAASKITYRRDLTIAVRETQDTGSYEQLRGLFAAVERNDAQPLALVRRKDG